MTHVLNRNRPDAELMQSIHEGDENALMALYHRYGADVYSLALQVLNQPHLAEEVTQDIFLKLWQRGDQWDPHKGRLISWLLTVTRNAAIDRLRREQRRPLRNSVDLEAIMPLMGTPARVDEPRWENGRLLRSLLEQLPPEQQTVIELAYYAGMSHSEMADHLDLPLGTVKTRVRLGMEKLRRLWQESTQSEES